MSAAMQQPQPRIGMATPWGAADSMRALSPPGDVIQVATCSHGGMGVWRHSRNIPVALRRLAVEDFDVDWLWFEEDLCWAGVVLALPDLFTNELRSSAESTLRNCCPDIYAAHFGRRPTAAESEAVKEEELRERQRENFVPRTAFGDWAWDVPKGHVYVVGERSSDKTSAGFLLTNAEYEHPHGLVLDGFRRGTPDTTLPYSKPRDHHLSH